MLRASAVVLSSAAVGAGVSGSIADTATAADAKLTVAGDEATVRNDSLAAVRLDLGVDWNYAAARSRFRWICSRPT